MARFQMAATGNFKITMAKKRFLRTGDYKEYIDECFKVSTISNVSRRTAVVSGVSFKSDLRTYQINEEEYLQNLDVIGDKPVNEELVTLLDVYHDGLIEELRGYKELSEFQLNMIAAYV